MQVAIDSSVLVGLLIPNDVWHSQADALWKAIAFAGHTGIYFDCVAADAVSVAVRRLHEKSLSAEVGVLLDRLNRQVPRETITWILPDAPRLWSEALELMRTSAGELNFNDALIALACRERELLAIASFDDDFDEITWLRRLARPEDLIPPFATTNDAE